MSSPSALSFGTTRPDSSQFPELWIRMGRGCNPLRPLLISPDPPPLAPSQPRTGWGPAASTSPQSTPPSWRRPATPSPIAGRGSVGERPTREERSAPPYPPSAGPLRCAMPPDECRRVVDTADARSALSRPGASSTRTQWRRPIGRQRGMVAGIMAHFFKTGGEALMTGWGIRPWFGGGGVLLGTLAPSRRVLRRHRRSTVRRGGRRPRRAAAPRGCPRRPLTRRSPCAPPPAPSDAAAGRHLPPPPAPPPRGELPPPDRPSALIPDPSFSSTEPLPHSLAGGRGGG